MEISYHISLEMMNLRVQNKDGELSVLLKQRKMLLH